MAKPANPPKTFNRGPLMLIIVTFLSLNVQGVVIYKVPGGKLLRVSVDHEGEMLRKVKLSGDFFMHPEDALESLEAKLTGVRLSQVRGIVESELSEVRMYGIDAKSIIRALWEASS
jgi:hypothetical protein